MRATAFEGGSLIRFRAFVARLGKGAIIGLANSFALILPNTGALAFIDPAGHLGHWVRPGRGYLGFEFLSHAERHFGWVAGSVSSHGSGAIFGFRISEYAYDTVAGQTIRAGQTSAAPEPRTLALLALGAMGLAVLRRRKLSAASNGQFPG